MPFDLQMNQPPLNLEYLPIWSVIIHKEDAQVKSFFSMFMKHVEPVIENEIKAINLFWIQAKGTNLKVEERACVVDVVALVVDVVVPGRCFCFV